MTCRHTLCANCGQDIEGIAPYRNGEWRDRGNNSKCHSGMHAGEPHSPNASKARYWFAEVTDTFAGEANYCWVRRYRIRAATQRGAVCKLSKETNYSFRNAYDERYNAQGACVCAFVSVYDHESHGSYTLQTI